MPGYDRTGPRGFGSRTGGGFGYCQSPGTFNAPAGRGIRRGLGGARGLGWGSRVQGRLRSGWVDDPWNRPDQTGETLKAETGAVPPTDQQHSEAIHIHTELATIMDRLEKLEKNLTQLMESSS
jgi:hypothetical protein